MVTSRDGANIGRSWAAAGEAANTTAASPTNTCFIHSSRQQCCTHVWHDACVHDNPASHNGELRKMNRRNLLLATGSLMLAGRAARAADEVIVGSVYPLTGNNAQVGLDAKVAIEVAAD